MNTLTGKAVAGPTPVPRSHLYGTWSNWNRRRINGSNERLTPHADMILAQVNRIEREVDSVMNSGPVERIGNSCRIIKRLCEIIAEAERQQPHEG